VTGCADDPSSRPTPTSPRPVLYDPTGAYAAALAVTTNDEHLVMTRGSVIFWKGNYADAEAPMQIDAALAASP
jgi:hypothetical protein